MLFQVLKDKYMFKTFEAKFWQDFLVEIRFKNFKVDDEKIYLMKTNSCLFTKMYKILAK